MNILPKKRWHVRTKDNIARVRRDEAKAVEEENVRQERIKLADREARRKLLLEKSRSNLPIEKLEIVKKEQSTTDNQKHVNFFEEIEDGTSDSKKINEEHEMEKRKEKEIYEKQIGYLTYLGQDTNEATGKQSWYNVAPNRKEESGEVNMKSKLREDPLEILKKYKKIEANVEIKGFVPSVKSQDVSVIRRHHKSKKKKRHKSKKHSSKDEIDSSDDDAKRFDKMNKIKQLRIERLKRENEERTKAEELLNSFNKGNSSAKEPKKQRYNSQFNPELAKQNF